MNTWVKTFRCDYFSEVESEINEYSKAFEATPLTVSIATNYGTFYVVVVFKKSEDTE